jgi:hypothetical protein
MDQDTLRFLLREAVRETVTEVLQTVLDLGCGPSRLNAHFDVG